MRPTINSIAVALMLLTPAALASTQGAAPYRYDPKDCPVVGNTDSKIYHVPAGKFYERMLVRNARGDNRQCFKSEDEAAQSGYRKSKR